MPKETKGYGEGTRKSERQKRDVVHPSLPCCPATARKGERDPSISSLSKGRKGEGEEEEGRKDDCMKESDCMKEDLRKECERRKERKKEGRMMNPKNTTNPKSLKPEAH